MNDLFMALHIDFHHPIVFFPNALYLLHLFFCPFQSDLSFFSYFAPTKRFKSWCTKQQSYSPTCEDLALRYTN